MIPPLIWLKVSKYVRPGSLSQVWLDSLQIQHKNWIQHSWVYRVDQDERGWKYKVPTSVPRTWLLRALTKSKHLNHSNKLNNVGGGYGPNFWAKSDRTKTLNNQLTESLMAGRLVVFNRSKVQSKDYKKLNEMNCWLKFKILTNDKRHNTRGGPKIIF